MLENLDYTNPEVVRETCEWGRWIVRELGLEGFRLDAVQHYSWNFVNKWSKFLQAVNRRPLLFVGEFWHGDVRVLNAWLDNMSPSISLFDVPLFYNIARTSRYETPDLRDIFKETLVESRPSNAIVSQLFARRLYQ